MNEAQSLETSRLLLRHWREEDAQDLYTYASDPAIGPIAGWPVHTSIAESKEIITTVLSAPETYAICLKPGMELIGAIELRVRRDSHSNAPRSLPRTLSEASECELGYWLGKPFWGHGFMPESVFEVLRHAFEDLGMTTVFSGYYDGNIQSQRVQEKVGLRYLRTMHNVDVPLMNERRTRHISIITKDDWAQTVHGKPTDKRVHGQKWG